MNKALLSFALGLSLVSVIAEGADWKSITGNGSEDVDISVDQESIEHISDDVVRARIKYVYSKPRSFDSGFIKELVVHNEYHCRERKCKILRSEGHFTDGTQKTDSNEREGYILPGDAVYEHLCK